MTDKFKRGDTVEVTDDDLYKGLKKVVIGVVDMDANNGKKKTVEKKKLRPMPGSKNDVTEPIITEVPVQERTTGYLVQDPELPWNRSNCTWIREGSLKKA